MEPGELLRIEKEVYGTVLGSASWRTSLTGEIVAIGYKKSTIDPCAFILPAEDNAKARAWMQEFPRRHLSPVEGDEWLLPRYDFPKNLKKMPQNPAFEATQDLLLCPPM